MTDEGREFLAEKYGAKEFRKKDARFVVNISRLEEVFHFFQKCDLRYIEIDPKRELIKELTEEELVSISPVLSQSEVLQIKTTFVKTVRQAVKDTMGTSTLEVEGTPSRRLFHLFDMVAPQAIIEKMRESEGIRFLTFDEVMTTEGGAHKGQTSDGITLADNILW